MNRDEQFGEEDFRRLRQELPNLNTRHFEELPSTNDWVLEYLKTGVPFTTPLLVLADAQTAGRGRGPNRWWSAGGSLTFTLVIKASAFGLRRGDWPCASLTTGLAIGQTLLAVEPGADISVKWPNDVFMTQRKVCGVLIETSSEQDLLIIGVGLNVNNTLAEAPLELRRTATSMRDAIGRRFCRTEMLIRLLRTLMARIRQVAGDPEQILEQWRELCLLTGRQVTVESGGRLIKGMCRGIDASGALVIEDESGGQENCFAGVVIDF